MSLQRFAQGQQTAANPGLDRAQRLAFGTGTHPTTRMCLESLELIAHPGQQVLDMGAGSGILSIAAARLGAASVLAVEISE